MKHFNIANATLKYLSAEPTYIRMYGSRQENLLSKENTQRTQYIKALKMADKGDFSSLIKMHSIMYE